MLGRSKPSCGSRSAARRAAASARPLWLSALLCLSCGARAPVTAAPPQKSGPSSSAKAALPAEAEHSRASRQGTEPAPANAAPEAAPAAPAVPTELGGPGPVALEAMAPDGRWLAYCQPTTDTNADGTLGVSTNERGELVGDLPDVYLSLSGSSERIDELLAFDASGRWLVARAAEQVWLIDATSEQRVELGGLSPDLRGDELFDVAHRSFSFDQRGQRLLVLSHTGRFRYEAHLLTLPAEGEGPVDVGAARKIPLSPGETWRAQLSPDGAALAFQTMLYEPGKAANFRWPAPLRDGPLRRCRGQLTQASAFAHRGGTITTLLGASDEPSLQATPGFVMHVQGGFLRRENNGRLLLVRNGTQKQVASERCGARVLHADLERELFLISCEHFALEKPKPAETKSGRRKSAPPKYRFELYLVAPGFVKDLESDMAATNLDSPPSGSPRLVPLRPGPRSVLVDMERRQLLELGSDDRIITTHQAKALVRRGRELVVFDADSGEERVLAAQVKAFPEIRLAARYAFVEPYLVDLDNATILLEHAAAPLSLTNTGLLLVPSAPAEHPQWAEGPLRWLGP